MDTVRLARPKDYTALKEWDEFWGDRRQEMQRGELLVFDSESAGVVGYLLLSRNTFLNYPFIPIVCVKDTHRRNGVGSSLLLEANSVLSGARHFTSTEPQNNAAKSLFESVGFKYVGELSHVNFDKSAELFYVRARLILNAYDEFESNEDKVSAVDLYDEYLLLGLYDTEDVASRYERFVVIC